MTSFLLNISAMTALTTLKGISHHLDITSNRISTGQRVSGASDNAAYWSIATAVRTDNASLSAVKDSLGLGSSAVNTAYNGLNSIITDLHNIRAKLQTAMTPGVDRSKVQIEIAAIQSKMKATAESSNSNGQNWLSVDSSSATYRSKQNIVAGFTRASSGTLTFATFPVDISNIKLYDLSSTVVRTDAAPASLFSDVPIMATTAFAGRSSADFTAGQEVSLQITSSGATDTIRLNSIVMTSYASNISAVSPEDLTQAINAEISRSSALAGKLTASLTTDGRLSFTTTAVGSTASLTLQSVPPSVGRTSVELAVSPAASRELYEPAAFATSAYNNIDLSGTNTKTITLGDGTSSLTYTFDSNTQPPPANLSSVTFDELSDMFLRERQRVSADFFMNIGSLGGLPRFVAVARAAGPSSTIIVNGPDAAAFGFTPGQSAVGSEVVRPGAPKTSTGRDGSATTPVRGLLDTVGSSGYATATLDISTLNGASGDAQLQIISQDVEAAIAYVSDAGTKLGASKTQIDGQKIFISTLIKSNDRIIGILVDADIEEESTKLKALQTQQQLAMQALSIANSSSQNILSLFR
ncbi:flagellin [Methylobacterium sp. ap11]|uniref:flagellin N-terminal helical domain-containing protein n=1 Tax=Methylobacterium sp. ap11 TaxID=1761799 RepID=UPI0008CFFBD0|nr:flagellin [Methylobacterium sp. ap11]SEP50293.1 flagellin [Methylobacterium sp. ap11]